MTEVHIWRTLLPDEPQEEGGVCVKCGAYATSEHEEPCHTETCPMREVSIHDCAFDASACSCPCEV